MVTYQKQTDSTRKRTRVCPSRFDARKYEGAPPSDECGAPGRPGVGGSGIEQRREQERRGGGGQVSRTVSGIAVDVERCERVGYN